MFCIRTHLSSGWALNMRHIPDELPTAGPAADRGGDPMLVDGDLTGLVAAGDDGADHREVAGTLCVLE